MGAEPIDTPRHAIAAERSLPGHGVGPAVGPDHQRIARWRASTNDPFDGLLDVEWIPQHSSRVGHLGRPRKSRWQTTWRLAVRVRDGSGGRPLGVAVGREAAACRLTPRRWPCSNCRQFRSRPTRFVRSGTGSSSAVRPKAAELPGLPPGQRWASSLLTPQPFAPAPAADGHPHLSSP